eukprot:UC1_evm1s248
MFLSRISCKSLPPSTLLRRHRRPAYGVAINCAANAVVSAAVASVYNNSFGGRGMVESSFSSLSLSSSLLLYTGGQQNVQLLLQRQHQQPQQHRKQQKQQQQQQQQQGRSLSPPRRHFASFYDAHIVHEYAQRKTDTMQGIERLIKMSAREVVGEEGVIASAQYLHDTLPVRLARRIIDIHELPYIAGINPHVQEVHDIYMDAFQAIRRVPRIENLDQEAKFHHLLYEQLSFSKRLLRTLAKAGKEMAPHMRKSEHHAFLDQFVGSRIGRRVLADQYSSLRARYYQDRDAEADEIGFVVRKADPVWHGRRAFNIAAELCRAKYGFSPELVIEGPDTSAFNYIPRHIDYMLLELFKNAARAV